MSGKVEMSPFLQKEERRSLFKKDPARQRRPIIHKKTYKKIVY